MGKPKSVYGCSCSQPSLLRAAGGCHGILELCWTEAGRTHPIGTPGLHLQRSRACYPEINWQEWMQTWPQHSWSGHIPLPEQVGLQGWRQKHTQGLAASSPTFALCWGEMGSHTRGGSCLDGQLQPLLAPGLLLVPFSA